MLAPTAVNKRTMCRGLKAVTNVSCLWPPVEHVFLHVKNMLVIGAWTVLICNMCMMCKYCGLLELLRDASRPSAWCFTSFNSGFKVPQAYPNIPKHPQAFLDPRVAFLVVPLIVLSIILVTTLVQFYQAHLTVRNRANVRTAADSCGQWRTVAQTAALYFARSPVSAMPLPSLPST